MTDTAVRPGSPAFGDRLPAAQPSPDTLALLAQRRSTPAIGLTDPGPNGEEIETLLRLASRVPDHGKLAPWRFIVFSGEARIAAGEVLANAYTSANPDAAPEMIAAERARFSRAPLVIAVVSTARENIKIPLWEQELAAGAVCFALLTGAHAMGYAGQWLTEWCAFNRQVLAAFGLGPGERLAGYLYLGTAKADAVERVRPDIPARTTHWTAPV